MDEKHCFHCGRQLVKLSSDFIECPVHGISQEAVAMRYALRGWPDNDTALASIEVLMSPLITEILHLRAVIARGDAIETAARASLFPITDNMANELNDKLRSTLAKPRPVRS